MTWVLAQPTIFGQVLALSDIQITFTDSKGNKFYKDCLQKMYAMDDNFIVGFAGNPFGGFAMLSKLSEALRKVKNGNNNLFPEPEKVINAWVPIAKRLFNNLVDEAKNGEVHLLMAGVSHSEDVGLPGHGKPVVATLKSPDFTPTFAKIGEWISIGSGSGVEEYKKILEKLSGEKTYPIMQMEVNNSGGFASALGLVLIMDVQQEAERKGISKHFHVAIVSREGVMGGNSDHTDHMGELTETKIVMPKVATTLKEFEDYIKKEFGVIVSVEAEK